MANSRATFGPLVPTILCSICQHMPYGNGEATGSNVAANGTQRVAVHAERAFQTYTARRLLGKLHVSLPLASAVRSKDSEAGLVNSAAKKKQVAVLLLANSPERHLGGDMAAKHYSPEISKIVERFSVEMRRKWPSPCAPSPGNNHKPQHRGGVSLRRL